MGLICLKGLPLFRGEHTAEAKEHAGVGFFQFCSRLRDAVDLSQDLAFIGLISRKQGLHRHLFFSHPGAQVHQAGPALFENGFHFLLLVRSEGKFFHEVGIVPPSPAGAQMKRALHRGTAAFHGRWAGAVCRAVGRWCALLANGRPRSQNKQEQDREPSRRSAVPEASWFRQCACSLRLRRPSCCLPKPGESATPWTRERQPRLVHPPVPAKHHH
jgi:hypothetical protein